MLLWFYWLVCFCCYSVFFFKQKTAYEMRISDWSSDVCSSDLVRLGPRDAQSFAIACAAGGGRGNLQHAGQILPGQAVGVGHDEIGRASCRERVCQYV